jgi:hypothetical protein
LAAVLSAQTVSFDIKKPKELKFADEFNLEIEAKYPQEYLLEPVPLKSADLKITSAISSKPQKLQDTLTHKFTFKVLPFVLGEKKFPPLNWNLKDLKTGKTYQVKSPEFPVKITEIEKPKDLKDQIYDIYGIFKPVNYFLIILIILAVLILLAAVYFIIRRKRKYVLELKPTDTRPPHIIAYEAIEKLNSSGLWEGGRFKLFYINLSDISRFYIEKRFKISAHKLTSLDL